MFPLFLGQHQLIHLFTDCNQLLHNDFDVLLFGLYLGLNFVEHISCFFVEVLNSEPHLFNFCALLLVPSSDFADYRLAIYVNCWIYLLLFLWLAFLYAHLPVPLFLLHLHFEKCDIGLLHGSETLRKNLTCTIKKLFVISPVHFIHSLLHMQEACVALVRYWWIILAELWTNGACFLADKGIFY